MISIQKHINHDFLLQQTIHGECDISYTITDDAIYKSMSLDKDCPNRPLRKVDDIRGHHCTKEVDKANGLVSTSSTILTYENAGNGFKVTSMFRQAIT